MSPADDQGAVAAAPPPFKPLPQKAPDVSIEKTPDGRMVRARVDELHVAERRLQPQQGDVARAEGAFAVVDDDARLAAGARFT